MAKFVALVLVSFLAVAAKSAPFINLDFELGTTNSSQVQLREVSTGGPRTLTFGTGPVRDLLPGWSVFLGGQRADYIAFGSGYYQWPDPFRMPAHAALLDRGDYFWAPGPIPIDGNYALALDNARRSPGENAAVLVSQTGDVPPNAGFLIFRSYPTYGVGDPALLIDDQRFDFFDFNQDPNDPTRFSLDISPWAGKTVTLGIFLPHDAPAVVDSIAFLAASNDVLTIARSLPADGQPPQVMLGFEVVKGNDYFVEFREGFDLASLWQALPGAPHNSGAVVDSAVRPQRFYRLRSVPNALSRGDAAPLAFHEPPNG